MWPIVTLSILVILLLKTTSLNEQRSDLTGIWSELVLRSATTLQKECPSCVKFVNNIAAETSRLESIKKAILEGLGMTEPPKINMTQLSIPFPIRNGDILGRESAEEEEVEEPTSTHPSKIMVVSSDTKCEETENGYDITFKIEIPWNVHSGELTEAKLWLYTDSETNINNCNLYSRRCSVGITDYFNEIYIDGNDFKDGWSQLDITSPFNNWVEYEELCQEIKMNCNDQVNEFYRSVYTSESENKPFITVHLSPSATVNRNRNKRNINCVANSVECCRERLVVSFAQIKWDNWIIQPATYEAYYCKGRCDQLATLTFGSTPYNTVLHKLKMNTDLKDKFPDLRLCCAPTRLSSLQIIYVNQNGTYLENTIPNMSVLSCGCV